MFKFQSDSDSCQKIHEKIYHHFVLYIYFFKKSLDNLLAITMLFERPRHAVLPPTVT